MPAVKTRPKRRSLKPKSNGWLRTFVVDDQTLVVPDWVKDLPSFRQWVHSDDVPEQGARICFFKGEVWVDMSKEQIFSHADLKTEYAGVLRPLCKKARIGRYFVDGALLTNNAAGLESQPDGLFVSADCIDAGRVQLVEGKKRGYVELEGTPDMVLEVVSDGSVKKDLEILFELYWQAGIPEYWVVDARDADNPLFIIYQHRPDGYVAVTARNGWLRSGVFGKAFRLTSEMDKHGYPEFTLEVR